MLNFAIVAYPHVPTSRSLLPPPAYLRLALNTALHLTNCASRTRRRGRIAGADASAFSVRPPLLDSALAPIGSPYRLLP
jgi:hypothetical protein